ncbi:MAG: ComEC family competence protein [Cyclobacteriaceae bacterium]|nr:ComEC family competence protein [Cyclobacteriaceae bacterium]
MFFWTPYTFVRIVSFFIAGILLGIYQPDFLPEHFALPALVGSVVLYFFLSWKLTSDFKPFGTGLVGLLAIFLAGYVNTMFNTDSRRPDHLNHVVESVEKYSVVITGYAEEKEKSWKVEGVIQQYHNGAEWKNGYAKVLLYLSRKDFEKPFSYGDRLLINGSPQELQGPANPGEFNYKRFLTFRKIYHQHFLRSSQVHYIENTPPSIIVAYSFHVRRWAENVLSKHITGEQERSVAAALILGVKDGLDNDLVQAYASSGAMHVLAVSGLHVGIIYLILSFVLKPLHKWRYGKWVLAVISIFVLWSYAFVTGLSPSVLRAVTMFSVIAISRPLNYRTNIYNTLAVAAFILLVWEPYLIMSVGFQLSFLAVIGIVYIQPKLYWLWQPPNFFFDKVWQITCVSIAAQMATCSLGLLYFHQFPLYFLFSNLFVIPGAFISLLLGVLLLVVSGVEPVALVVGSVLEFILWLLNYLVFSVEQLPYSLINNIYITTFQSWLLMGILVSALLLLQYRRFAFVMALFFSGFTFGLVHWYHYREDVNHEKFVVYRVAGQSAMEWMTNGQSFFIADSTLMSDRDRMRFHIRPNRLISGVHRVHTNEIPFMSQQDGARLFAWKNQLILQIITDNFFFPEGMEVDYIVLSGNSIQDISKLTQLTCKQFIIDSSNSIFTATKIMKQAEEFNLPVYSVLHQGAFITKL